MNINPNVRTAQPSFQAKFKENQLLKDVVKRMNSDDYKNYEKLTKRLANVSEGDVLELKKKDKNENNTTEYYVENKKKGTKCLINVFNKKYNDTKWADLAIGLNNTRLTENLLTFMEEVITPKSDLTNKMLTEPATKDQRTMGEKIRGFIFSNNDSGHYYPLDTPTL